MHTGTALHIFICSQRQWISTNKNWGKHEYNGITRHCRRSEGSLLFLITRAKNKKQKNMEYCLLICIFFRGKFQRMLKLPGNSWHYCHSLSEPAYVDIFLKKNQANVNMRGFHRFNLYRSIYTILAAKIKYNIFFNT